MLTLTVPLLGFTFLDPVAQKNERGNELFEAAAYDSALAHYRDAQTEKPDLSELHFNAGRTFYELEQYDDAAREFGRAAETDDLQLKAESLLNLGNAHFKSQKLQEAVESYKEALDIQPQNSSSKQNLKLALSMMQKQEQPQQGQPQNDQENQDQENQEQDPNEQNQEQHQNQEEQEDPEQQNEESQEDPGEPEQQESQPEQDSGDQSDEEKQQEASSDPSEPQDQQEGEQPPPQEGDLSEEEAERLLDALKERELEAQKKYRFRQAKGESRGKEW
jgi:Ca-activated chloride channel family protein